MPCRSHIRRHGVGALRQRRGGWEADAAAAERRGAGADDQNVAARKTRHERVLVRAARSSSHHQTVGKAEKPYFGSGSGWPKRSQRAVRILP